MAFIQSLANGDQNLCSTSDFDVQEFIEQNEWILDEIFLNVKTVKQLKSYCSRYLGMVQPQEIVLHRYTKKWQIDEKFLQVYTSS